MEKSFQITAQLRWEGELQISLVQPPFSKQGQKQLTQHHESVSFPCTCKMNGHSCDSPPPETFLDPYLPTQFSGKYSYQWVNAELSFEPIAGRRQDRYQTTSQSSSLSLQKISRDGLSPVILSRDISLWKCLLPTHQQEICLPVSIISSIGLPVSQPVDFLGRMHGSSVCSGSCLRMWW